MSIGTITLKDASGVTKTLNAIDTGSGGPYVPLHAVSDSTGTPINPATEATLATVATALSTAKTISVWTDNTGVYFVRNDLAGVITWVKMDGTSSSAPGTGARPVAGPPTSIGIDSSNGVNRTIATQTGFGNVLLKTLDADPTRIGKFFIQNQSNGNFFVFFDDGTSSALDDTDASRTMIIVASGGSTGQQGGSISDADTGLFKGRIRIITPASSSQLAFRYS